MPKNISRKYVLSLGLGTDYSDTSANEWPC